MKNQQRKTSRIDTSNTSPKYWEKVLAEHEDPPSVDEDAMEHADLGLEEPTAVGRKSEPVKSTDLQRLRKDIDGDDPFMDRPNILKPANKDAVKKVPDWVMNDELVRAVLLQAFPKLQTNPRQRKQAARWAAIISLYYRNGWSQPYVYGALNISENVLKCALKQIRKSAAKVIAGQGRSRGRPKKATPTGD